ncbi:hypothetical protein GCM10020331_084160 [Ectobacillus funiculus]
MTSAGSGKVGWALQQEYAEAAAVVLAGNGHENTVYELSGKLMTQEELAAALGTVLGKEVPVQQVDDAAYADIMKGAGVPEFVIPFLVEIQKKAFGRELWKSRAMILKKTSRSSSYANQRGADSNREWNLLNKIIERK